MTPMCGHAVWKENTDGAWTEIAMCRMPVRFTTSKSTDKCDLIPMRQQNTVILQEKPNNVLTPSLTRRNTSAGAFLPGSV